MSRTARQILESAIGEQIVNYAYLLAQYEALTEEANRLRQQSEPVGETEKETSNA